VPKQLRARSQGVVPATLEVSSVPPDSALLVNYRTLRELAQQHIRQDILQARFPPGTRLVESQLAQRYGISRGPIREALRSLEGEGLVRFPSNRSPIVNALTPDEIREIYEMRLALEGLAAGLGAETITDVAQRRLGVLVDQLSESIDDPDTWFRLNTEFHLTLYRASGRARLCSAILELMNVLEPYMRMQIALHDQTVATHRTHRPILVAAMKRDGASCATATRAHLRAGAQVILNMALAGTAQPAGRPEIGKRVHQTTRKRPSGGPWKGALGHRPRV